MMEVWFDGSLVVPVGDILQEYAPRAMIFQGKHATIRWVGNESGVAPDPNWNAVPMDVAESGTSTAKDGDPRGDAWLPNECDARIRAHWFWNSKNAATLKTVDQLMEIYYASVGRGAVLLLNHTPDPTGRIPEADARRAAEFGAEIKRRFGTPVVEASGRGSLLEIELGEPVRIDHVMIQEDIAGGQRVLEYVLEGMAGDEWKELSRGTSVGYKKIDRFEPVRVSKIRFRCTESLALPLIKRFAVFDVGGR